MLNNRTTNISTIIILLALIGIDLSIHLSIWYYIFLVVSYIGIKTYGSITLSADFFTPSKCVGGESSGAVALTFDDGPLPEKTERILALLNNYNIKATFFCIGNRVEKNPKIVKKINEQGHLVGNHSFSHGKLFDLQSADSMSEELRSTDNVIEKVINARPKFFRPPYGVTNPNLAKAIKKGNYITTGWSIRSLDTVIKNEERLFNSVTKKLKSGDVILLHDSSEATIAILPRLIEFISKRGLKVVRLDELLNERPYV